MSTDAMLGPFEQAVLAAILTLQDNAYGVTIHTKVTQLVEPKTASLGAIYVTLERLEEKGLLRSWRSDPLPARGGRAKRCYALEAAGEQALRDSAPAIQRMHEILSQEFGGRRWKPVRAR
jgi:PadR family transcriptional regulator PadR